MGLTSLKFGFQLLFSIDERLELGNRANGKEISDVPFQMEKEDYLRKLLFHLTSDQKFPDFLAKW